MTRQNRKPRSTHTHAEPRELEADRADITGKEPVLVRDWDQDSVILAIRNMQIDIIDEELEYLLQQPAWHRRARKRYRHELFEGADIEIPGDLVEKTLAACRLDNLKVIYEESYL